MTESYDFQSQLIPIKHIFVAFFLLYYFDGIYVLYKKIRKLKDCLIIYQNAYDFKKKKPNASLSG